jgi:CBS domain-containing protein
VQGDNPDWSSALRAVPLHIVFPNTKFAKVLEVLSVHKLHRVYVLDHKEHSIGIITLTDILRQLLPKVEEIPSAGPGMNLPHSSEVPEQEDEAAGDEAGPTEEGA